ncbi:hypothetical protein [Vulcanisaeta distributa]|uniref:Uncharacterized protein n=1 Tax=Vulcanisaeta distributa (strain DSM 14429 / JCM 11212 / NBRC 100878 / IC-017) TaxID=572478 RepID=E1QSD2_VULDI|nr:hypothetical protein [Vulcanisaeta distributa]ADN49525.1 hypothetical protein Vdis_0112 [Vulcanisaeta distributa DSM 14429]
MSGCGDCYIVGTVHVMPVNGESLLRIMPCITHVVYEGVRDDITLGWLLRNMRYLPLVIAFKLHFRFTNKLLALLYGFYQLIRRGKFSVGSDVESVEATFGKHVKYVWGDYALTRLLIRLDDYVKPSWIILGVSILLPLVLIALLMITPHGNLIRIIYLALSLLVLLSILLMAMPIRFLADKTLMLRNERAAEVAAELIKSGARVLIVFGKDHVRGIREVLRRKYGIECLEL